MNNPARNKAITMYSHSINGADFLAALAALIAFRLLETLQPKNSTAATTRIPYQKLSRFTGLLTQDSQRKSDFEDLSNLALG
jgi:hypothetical protein